MYNGLTNKITFTHKENKFSFHPLLLSQVVEYQVQMRNKRNEEKKGSNLENKNEWGGRDWCSFSQGHSTWEHFDKKISLKRVLHVQQPSYLLLCKRTPTCTPTSP